MSRVGSSTQFRFLHASDFHLEQPLGGVCEVPNSLRELFLNAPYQAAERVFNAAVEEEVDFILLAGDLLHPAKAGPKAIEFLRGQFDRLAGHDISVYWTAGRADRAEHWPQIPTFTDNVHFITSQTPEEIEHRRGDEYLATIVAAAAGSKRTIDSKVFRNADSDSAFRIAMAFGTWNEKSPNAGVDYWALGSLHEWKMSKKSFISYCGTPQGRKPNETGPHGCVLVDVEPGGHIETRRIETDVVRWLSESIQLAPDTDASGLEPKLRNSIQQLRDSEEGRQLFVDWEVSANAEVEYQLRRGDLSQQVLKRLNGESSASSGLWSHAIRPDNSVVVPRHSATEDTILGDFMDAVKNLRSDPSQIDFGSMLEQSDMSDELIAMLQFTNDEELGQVLSEVETLGMDLLSGEHQLSKPTNDAA